MKEKVLFCIPYAGATAAIYKKWEELLDPSILLIPIELPGRGKRISDPPLLSIQEMVEDIINIIQLSKNRLPFSIFGHSMGNLLAYEVSKHLEKRGLDQPEILFLSGKNPPHCRPKTIKHLLPDDKFRQEIIKMGGIPKVIEENKELMDFFLPIIRNDFQAVEQYSFKEERKQLHIPFVVLNGSEDEMTNSSYMNEWKTYSTSSYEYYEFIGGHFFIHEHINSIIALINKQMIGNQVR